jgi:hypothetical protein
VSDDFLATQSTVSVLGEARIEFVFEVMNGIGVFASERPRPCSDTLRFGTIDANGRECRSACSSAVQSMLGRKRAA